MVSAVMYSSASDNWATPQDLFNSLNDVFKFDLDAAASKDNAKCLHYFTAAENGLEQAWTGNVWLNPPYGRQIGAWVKKAYDEVMRGGHLRWCSYFLRALIQCGFMIIVKMVLSFFCEDA